MQTHLNGLWFLDCFLGRLYIYSMKLLKSRAENIALMNKRCWMLSSCVLWILTSIAIVGQKLISWIEKKREKMKRDIFKKKGKIGEI